MLQPRPSLTTTQGLTTLSITIPIHITTITTAIITLATITTQSIQLYQRRLDPQPRLQLRQGLMETLTFFNFEMLTALTYPTMTRQLLILEAVNDNDVKHIDKMNIIWFLNYYDLRSFLILIGINKNLIKPFIFAIHSRNTWSRASHASQNVVLLHGENLGRNPKTDLKSPKLLIGLHHRKWVLVANNISRLKKIEPWICLFSHFVCIFFFKDDVSRHYVVLYRMKSYSQHALSKGNKRSSQYHYQRKCFLLVEALTVSLWRKSSILKMLNHRNSTWSFF